MKGCRYRKGMVISMEQFQQLIGIAPWTLIFTLLNLFLTICVVKHFFFGKISAMLEKRQALTDAQIRDAEAAKEEALAIKTEYETNMAQAKEKANEILNTAQKTAAIQSEEMIREATAQVAAMKAKAERDIAQEKKKAVNEIKSEIGDMAMEIAGKVIEREINDADHTNLINEFIANVGGEE